MGSPHSYGLIAAGSVGKTLIGSVPSKAARIGPVAAVSYRVASRIANSLKAGRAVRGLADVDGLPTMLFYAPPEQMKTLLDLCFSSPLDWRGKTIIFCDCEPPRDALEHFHREGTQTAVIQTLPVPGFAVIHGCSPARSVARRIVREAGLRPLEIACESAELFSAAVTLSTAAVTPLIDRAAQILRCAGVRDSDSVKVAGKLFEQSVRGYNHSGRQSWAWHISAPEPEKLCAELDALDPRTRAVMRQLLILGFESFDKHPELAALIRRKQDG